ncbi:hypothetical protein PINS_up021220 [Pythium insidiosum]|nr:hypothetical protein PINS_up021220 [Pythium insidiosum]
MIELLDLLGIQYVVLGNHEFDFGAKRCVELLASIRCTVLAANARLRSSNELLTGTKDVEIAQLPVSGLRLGVFGVLTSSPHEFVHHYDELMVLESEVHHAQRCVTELQAAGADLIVGLTHTRLAKDRQIARKVNGIDLLLGGHDHEPATLFEGRTLVHKSGCDARWLGKIDVLVSQHTNHRNSVHFEWAMYLNVGYSPCPITQDTIKRYNEAVAKEERLDASKNEVLAITRTALDGTRFSVRTGESNLANLITDALRDAFDGADCAVLNGGAIQGERIHSATLQITPRWLIEILPIPNPTICVDVAAGAFIRALDLYLKRYPDPNASFPHVSGIFVRFDPTASDVDRRMSLFRDRDHSQVIPHDTRLRVVATEYVVNEMPGCEFFQTGTVIARGGVIRDLVAAFLRKMPNREVHYTVKEGRFRIV